MWHVDVTLRLNSNEGRNKEKAVEDAFLNIWFLKLHSLSQGDWSMRISQLNTSIYQSIDVGYFEILTPYIKTMVAPVSLTYRYEINSILESIIRNLLPTYKIIN